MIEPVSRGPLVLREVGEGLIAEIGGERLPVDQRGGHLAFVATDGSRFEGVRRGGEIISGHWLQPPSPLDGNVYATPVRLRRIAAGWLGELATYPDTVTFYLLIGKKDGAVTADLINPERNLGVFQRLTRVERTGDAVELCRSSI